MRRLEVFFDYACPYCLRAHGYLKKLIPACPDLSVVWCPCEAHPRPDPYGPHSALCIQGLFFLQERRGDIWKYHDRMFRAALQDRAEIENIDVLSRYARGLVCEEDFRSALRSGRYRGKLMLANEYAWEKNGLSAVPSYRLDGTNLDSAEDVGVTENQLARFLSC